MITRVLTLSNLFLTVFAELQAASACSMASHGAPEMVLQLTHEYRDPFRASAGSLGRGTDGQISSHLGTSKDLLCRQRGGMWVFLTWGGGVNRSAS